MIIRRAINQDIDQLIELLSEVLELHAKIRPDIYNSGTTKYTKEELEEMIKDDDNPIYVAIDNDIVLGYTFYNIVQPKFVHTMKPIKILYIDDFCVRKEYRHQGIGKALFDFIKEEARRLDCYEICLFHWEGNDNAKAFYQKMGMKVKANTMEYILE